MSVTPPTNGAAADPDDPAAGYLQIHVDLTGSTAPALGPGWRSVDVIVDPPQDWTTERLRAEAALHFGVPVDQVGVPQPVADSDDG